jgi:hypothetical protein
VVVCVVVVVTTSETRKAGGISTLFQLTFNDVITNIYYDLTVLVCNAAFFVCSHFILPAITTNYSARYDYYTRGVDKVFKTSSKLASSSEFSLAKSENNWPTYRESQ